MNLTQIPDGTLTSIHSAGATKSCLRLAIASATRSSGCFVKYRYLIIFTRSQNDDYDPKNVNPLFHVYNS